MFCDFFRESYNIKKTEINMIRPDFDDIKDYAEFCKYYWYREELIKICKARGLKSDGSKIELNKVIEAYFAGEKILPEKKTTKPRKATVTELSLDSGLIGCGFTFGNRFRDFFRQQTGEEYFKFNVDMVATAKAVKESGAALDDHQGIAVHPGRPGQRPVPGKQQQDRARQRAQQ